MRSSFKTGAIALAFLVLGFELALFVHRAAESRIVANRDRPDTVYVYSGARRDVPSINTGGAAPSNTPAAPGLPTSPQSGSVPSSAVHAEACDRFALRPFSTRGRGCWVVAPNLLIISILQQLAPRISRGLKCLTNCYSAT